MSFWASPLLLASTWGALGEPGSQISLRVDASESCLPAEAFRRDLEAELSPYRFILSNAASAALSVAVRPEVGALIVAIRLERGAAEAFVRELSAHDCEEAGLAARFVVSVALGRTPELAESRSGSPDGAAPSTTGTNDPTRSFGTDDRENVPLLIPETSKTARGRSKARGSAPHESDAWLSGHVLVVGGPAPNLLLGGAVGVGWGSRRGGPWSPAVELEVAYSAAFPARAELGTASFDRGTVALLACPSLLGVGPLRLRPCALGHFGFLRATGSETYDPGSSTRPWVDVGLRLGLLVPVSKRVEIPIAGEVSYTFNRDSFSFDSEVFYSVPPAVAGGSVGVMVHLW